MNKILFGKKCYQVAGSYNELTPKQIRQVAKILSRPMDEKEAKIELLLILLKHRLSCYWLIFYRINPDDLRTKLFALTDFITSDEARLTKNPFPKIRIGFNTIWHGASDKLRNISFEEFCEADTFFMVYAKTQKADFLHRLIAILYRPEVEEYDPSSPNFKGDRREPFNSFSVESRIKTASKIRPEIQTAIFMFYAGSRACLVEEFEDLFMSGSGGKYDPKTWAKILRKVAGNLSHTDTIATMQARAVFFDLQESLQESELQNAH